MLLLIDNYDSFTYNLVQAFGGLDPGLEMKVVRNDAITTDEIAALAPERIVISPGPGTPAEGGVSLELIRVFGGKIPILGVCLGHQCIAHVYGGRVVRANRIVHGKTSRIRHTDAGVFRGVPNPFEATRYHSLIVEPGTLPDEFEVTATCEDAPDEIMGLRHRSLPIEGVQFHPESFMTSVGPKLLENFLRMG